MLGVLITFLVTGLTPSPAEATTLRRRLFKVINQTRVNHGLRILRMDRDLSKYCRRHSQDMAQQDRLYHTTDLVAKVRRYNAKWWGENVGYAGTLRRLRYLWMHSPGHRANLMNRNYRSMGVGVVHARGRLWATTIFYG